MADRYGTIGNMATVGTGYKTALAIQQAATARTRLKLYDFILSASAAPADNVLNWRIRRLTVAGTGTAINIEPVEGAASAASTAATANSKNMTAEPTYTANSELFQNSINQRATFRWVAAPGAELTVPATNSVGIGFEVKSPAYTGEAEVSAYWME